MIDTKNSQLDMEKAMKIADKYEIEKLTEDFELIKNESQNFKIYVLFIGSFSVGKSALLNRLIGKNILEESQAPETAIATELYNSTEEYMVLNKKDNSRQIITSKLTDEEISNSKYIEHYVLSENIEKLSDYTVVDTPGFDSGIERHNKALIQYIGKGTAYVLVIDVEKGTISKSVLDFINEISGYDSDIVVALNKCDKKIPEDISKIKKGIEGTLNRNFFTQIPVIETSIFDDDISDKLVNLINKFDPYELYEKKIVRIFRDKITILLNALTTMKKNQNFDEEDFNREIENREAAKKRLFEKLSDEKKYINNKLKNEEKYKILNEIKNKLIINVEDLVYAYKSGEETVKRKVVGIIRTILINKIESLSENIMSEVIENINISKIEVEDNSINIDEIQYVMSNVSEKLKSFENREIIKLPDKTISNNENILNDRAISGYTAITSALAITTSVVAPALELVIVLLPITIKLIKRIIDGSPEEQIKSKIQSEVIPRILSGLDEQIDKILLEVEKNMIENISFNIEEIIQSENEALEKIKEKKSSKKEEFNKFINEIETDIETLIEMGKKYDR